VGIVCRTKRYLESKLGAKEVLVVGSGGIEKNIDLILCRRFRGRGMSWSPEPVEAETAEIRPRRLESLLASKGELKSIRDDAGEKILCPKWAGILLRKKALPYLTRGG
jgi:hypothetical protein